ncbi:hypothetical protein JCM10207_004161 [Rhodosporidiobolus poonsookiae]
MLYKKKPSKAAADLADEFEEDNFEDDVDFVEASPSPSAPTGASRQQHFEAALSAVNATLARSSHYLKAHAPSQRHLVNLLAQTDAAQLPVALDALARWRKRGLVTLSGDTVALLAKRLSESDAVEAKEAVEVLVDRTTYGVDLPAELEAVHPLFTTLSRPQTVAEPAAPAAVAEGEEAPAAVEAAASPSPSAANLLYSLYTTARLHRPSETATDPVILLTTLSAFARTSTLSSPRGAELVRAVQAAGEDALVDRVRALGKRAKETVRMRSRVVALAMRDQGHQETEWFAHFAESVHSVARK